MTIALLRSIATNKEAISLALILGKSVEGRIKDLWIRERQRRRFNPRKIIGKTNKIIIDGGIGVTKKMAKMVYQSRYGKGILHKIMIILVLNIDIHSLYDYIW